MALSIRSKSLHSPHLPVPSNPDGCAQADSEQCGIIQSLIEVEPSLPPGTLTHLPHLLLAEAKAKGETL